MNPIVLGSLVCGGVRTFLYEENSLQSNYNSILTLVKLLVSIEKEHCFLLYFKWYFLLFGNFRAIGKLEAKKKPGTVKPK